MTTVWLVAHAFRPAHAVVQFLLSVTRTQCHASHSAAAALVCTPDILTPECWQQFLHFNHLVLLHPSTSVVDSSQLDHQSTSLVVSSQLGHQGLHLWRHVVTGGCQTLVIDSNEQHHATNSDACDPHIVLPLGLGRIIVTDSNQCITPTSVECNPKRSASRSTAI